MDKIKIVLSYAVYPMALAKYFEAALRARDDVELLTVGPYTGQSIPWNGGMTLPVKYSKPPNIPLSQSLIGNVKVHPATIENQIPWKNIDSVSYTHLTLPTILLV